MDATNTFSLEPINNAESRLYTNGSTYLFTVPGIKIEDQYFLPDGRFLIITSEDCPHEEMLHIILAKQADTQFEYVNIGQAFVPGLYANPRITKDGSLQFSFFDNATYRVTILPEPARNLGALFTNSAIFYDSHLKKRALSVELIRPT